MLNRLNIEAALPVVEKLKERNVRLLPKDNTPLMSLLLSVDRAGIDLSLAQNADMVSLVAERSKDVAHQLAMKDLVELGSQCVARTLDNARNVVLPHIKEMVTQVSNAAEGRRVSATMPYEIVMKEVPGVYTNQGILNLAARFNTQALTYPPARELAQVTLDDVVALAKTGMAGVDEDLYNLLSLNNNEGYATVQNLLLGKVGFGDIDYDYAAGVLVVANALYNEPTAGIKLGLADYNAEVNRLIFAAAAMVKSKAESYRRTRELGTLYVPGKNSITQVVVMGDAYRTLLDKGLTPETVLGNEMAGRRYTAGQLIENKTTLEQIYQREMTLRALRTQTEMFGITRNVIEQLISGEIAKLDGEAVNKAELFRRLKAEVNLLTEQRIGDLYSVLTDIVCNVFYPETDARTVILYINQVGAQFGPEADAREIALLATIKYVNSWMASQLCIAQA